MSTKKLKITDPEAQELLKPLAVKLKDLKREFSELSKKIDSGYRFDYYEYRVLKEDEETEHEETVYSVLGDIIELLGNAEGYLDEKNGLEVGYMSSYIHG